MALSACGQDGNDAAGATPTSSSGLQSTLDHSKHTSLMISGTPSTSVLAGSAYSFQPTATDSPHNTLTFSISNKPAWATFSASSGLLSGTPASGAAGSYANILISVSDGSTSASLPAFSITVTAPTAAPTPAPTISGTPSTSVVAGSAYSFEPTATDASGKTLTFSISNKPAWATFSASSGLLSGTPGSGAVGSYTNIVISVSDGTATASLPAFSITVSGVTLGSATLNWTPPTTNTDGSPLTDLSGFIIYYGTSASSLSQQISLTDPASSSYVVPSLTAGTWYFAVKATTTSGVDSGFSNTASKTI
ncbi:MAG TPA: putative Ig domain-containing protein [Steroidobacteraceae bacterium]|nr:putative Ig domain-containing protein [Steroidobacteraceae bacterium]